MTIFEVMTDINSSIPLIDSAHPREENECIELLETLRKKLEEGADDLQVLLDAADR